MLTLGNSDISGIGVFALNNIPKLTVIGEAFKKLNYTGKPDEDYCQSILGRYVNHSSIPNCKVLLSDDIYYISIENIGSGEELTVDYNELPWEGEKEF